MARTQFTGFRTIRIAAVAALAVLVAGGCTHTVMIDAPADPIAVDMTIRIQQEVVLTAAR